MKKALLPALLLLATSAHAADAYFGLGLGVSKVDGLTDQELAAAFDDGSFISGSTDNEDNAFRLFGGAQFNANVAVEIAYTDLGEFSGEATSAGGIFYFPGSVNYEVEGHALSLAIKGIAPISDKFNLYGKLGVARWSTYEELTNNGAAVGFASEEGTDPYLAIGAGFNATDSLSFQLEIERYSDVLEYDVDVMGAALVYKFK